MSTRTPIHINVKYSPEYDAIQVENTLCNLVWFKGKYPNFVINLPESLNNDNEKGVTKGSILASVQSEFDSTYYKHVEVEFKKEWEKVSSEITTSLNSIFAGIVDTYDVILTKYGIGGSYNLPNLVVLNCKTYSANRLVGVLIHEIVHLCIEPLIIKYEIQHDTKERVVDLIISQLLPDYNSKKERLDTKYPSIDETFQKFYPNIGKIIFSLRELK